MQLQQLQQLQQFQVQQVQQVQRMASHMTIRLTPKDVERLPQPEAKALVAHWRLPACCNVPLGELRKILTDGRAAWRRSPCRCLYRFRQNLIPSIKRELMIASPTIARRIS